MFGNNVTKIKVGGMMCEHCVATVKKVLGEIECIKSVDIVLKAGEVTIKHKGDFPLDKVQEVLAAADYKFEGVIE